MSLFHKSHSSAHRRRQTRLSTGTSPRRLSRGSMDEPFRTRGVLGLGGSSAVSESSSLAVTCFLIDIVEMIWSTPVDRLRTTIDMRA